MHERDDQRPALPAEELNDSADRAAGLEKSNRALSEANRSLLETSQQLSESNRQLVAANTVLAASSELQLRALFDLMPQLGWTARPDGYIEFYNRGWFDYTGTSPAEMEGWGWQRVHDPALLPLVMARWQRSIQDGEPFEMEFPLRRHDGVFRWFLTRVKPIRDAEGRVVRWVGVNTDIDDRRRAADVSQERLRLLIESIQDYAIFMLSPEGRVVTWNRGAQLLKGYSAEEIIGRSFTTFYPPADVAAGKCDRELEIAGRVGRFEDEGWRVRKDGTRFWAHVVLNAVRGRDGELLGFAKVTRDLSDRRAAELERARLIQAQEAIRMRDEFLSIASHELRTPLTTLQLQLQGVLRQRGSLDEKLVTRLQRAAASGDRLTELVDNLLDVARFTTGRPVLNRTTVDLYVAARDALDRFAEEAERARCQLVLHPGPPVVGSWDRLRLDQVLTNLIGNAIKYAAGKPVVVSVGLEGGQAVLRVTDEGPGIAPADLPRVFERFERASSSKNFGGLGLGLYIGRQLVEAHDGTLDVESEVGHGSTFTVRLPLEPRDAGTAGAGG